MNNGDDTAYYIHQGFRVLAIEADPALCSKASIRFKKEIDREQLTILNMGIASTEGTRDFWICETTSEWNSFDRHIASRDGLPHHSIPVPCQTFEWVLKKYGMPYYLKVDIEGNDELCINSLKVGDDLPKYVSIELGDIYKLTESFEALGYTGYKCVSQYNFLPLQLPSAKDARRFEDWERPPMVRNQRAQANYDIHGRERLWNRMPQGWLRGHWKFPKGSSGPFGEDTLGSWLTANEIRDTFDYYFHLFERRQPTPYWTDKDYSFWVDLHVRRED